MERAFKSDIPLDLLAGVLDTLIPQGDGYPGAGSPAMCAACVADADADGERAAIAEVLRACPPTFLSTAPDAREAMLKAIELSHPKSFAALVRHLSNAYYSAAEVRLALEADTGYPARPPHYEGYEMAPFDERSLEQQRRRVPFWRGDGINPI
jgi:hypothetical protein